MFEAGQSQAKVAKWCVVLGYGIKSKQVAMSPGKSDKVVTEHQHLRKTATLAAVSARRLQSALVTLPLRLKEEIPD
ncbi:hypothetical protein TNCV_2316921 [Trichonephila clavipes]|nr:hypothetical protein TNCV_2316921 [Trichonephila clavipes]